MRSRSPRFHTVYVSDGAYRATRRPRSGEPNRHLIFIVKSGIERGARSPPP